MKKTQPAIEEKVTLDKEDREFTKEKETNLSENKEYANLIEPATWKAASKTNETYESTKALENEYLSQIKNKTWEIVKRPKHE